MQDAAPGARPHGALRLLLFIPLVLAALACNLTAYRAATPPAEPTAALTPTQTPPTASPAGQDGGGLHWRDAPDVPVVRSEADWRIAMGWAAREALYNTGQRAYAEGDTETFTYDAGRTVEATLRAVGAHAYWWIETGGGDDSERGAQWLARAVRRFDEDIYPLTRTLFGAEATPGIDGDARVHILHMTDLGHDAVGVFDPYNQCPAALCPDSNELDMMFVGLDWGPVGSDQHLTTLAHEFQHLIGYNVDGNDFRWVQEGLSQLAEHLNGFDPWYIAGDGVREYLDAPDFNFTDWPFGEAAAMNKAYASAYLFMLYLYERFGADFIRALAHEPRDGLAGLQATLDARGIPESVDDLYADWTIANVLDDPLAGDGRYHYATYTLPRRPQAASYPGGVWAGEETVNQYGVDYLSVTQPGTYTLTFAGAASTPLLATPPASGAWAWWGYWNDLGAARLTAAFDLTGLARATLEYAVWHDIEPDYDWAHVEVSTDGGQRWEIVGGERMKPAHRLAAGPHYTGRSGGWVRDRVDLTPYAGGPVLVRFEYRTDGSFAGPGILIDDIGIPELGYQDDVETPGGVWQAEGFMRATAEVSQRWAVRIIDLRRDGPPTVQAVTLDADRQGEATFTVDAGSDGVVIAISATAPFTRAPAQYRFRIAP